MNVYIDQLKTIVFDIETLGLMPHKDMIISASFCDPKSGDVFQLFTDENNTEEKIIKEIYQQLDKYQAVITYNGDSFDLGFIKTRANKYGIKHDDKFWSIDLYRILKKYWPKAKQMPHLNQKSVEFALGLSDSRDDKIGGAECIDLYHKYLAGDYDAKELILLHNADDVRQLSRIYNKLNFLDFDQIFFERGFLLNYSKYVMIKAIRLNNNYLYCDAITTPMGIPSSIYDDNFEFEYDCLTGKISFKIYINNTSSLSYVDLNKLPVNKTNLQDLRGYHSDFLVLKENNDIKYQEINYLLREILTTGKLF